MRTLTQAALAAKQIKQDLKKAFPDVVFSVKSDNFSMGDSVNVSWTDGPLEEQVEELICQYEYGKFNGMEDIYEYTNRRDDIPQTKYLMCSRKRSLQTEEQLTAIINEHYGLHYTVGQYFHGDASEWNADFNGFANNIAQQYARKFERGI